MGKQTDRGADAVVRIPTGETAAAAEPPPDVGELLRAGDLDAAAGRLDEAIGRSGEPELRLLRGQVALFACDLDTARECLEAALAGFQAAGARRRAAMAASSLARLYVEGWGNRVVGRAWLRRASRLLEGEPECVERGWVAVALIGCGISDPAVLEDSALLALQLARRFGDPRLEARALAESGLALVSLGRVEEGMARLDEAMTVAMAPGVGDPLLLGDAGCCLFTACDRAADLARAEGWLRLAEEMEIATANPMATAHCGAVYGALLLEVGRWSEAERVLQAAVESADQAGQFFVRLESRAALAELRVRQGRLAEAEQLLVGFDDRVEVLSPLARLCLARGDHELAAVAARRAVRLLGADQSRASPLLRVVVEAEVAGGDLHAAAAAAARLTDMAARSGRPMAAAHAALAVATLSIARDEPRSAEEALEDALVALGDVQLPLLRAEIHFALARVHAPTDRVAAIADARAATALYARIGAPLGAGAARLARALGVTPPNAPTPVPATMSWDGATWTVTYAGAVARLRDSKGMRYLAALLAQTGVERHVFDLVDVVEGLPEGPGQDRRRLGDAGALLDAQARSAYRRRLLQLREAMDDAEACGHDQRAEQIQLEIDALAAELARGMGLGGRERRAASAADRARLNVTRALRTAIARIGQVHPPLGRYLDKAVRTGLFCSYQPPEAPDIHVTVGHVRPSARPGATRRQ